MKFKVGATNCLILSLLIPVLVTNSCQAKKNTYYISTNGKNTNDGLSPKTAWKTIKNLEPGNTYLLNRGDTLYFSIAKIENNIEADTIIIGTYGKGNKPVLSCYQRINPGAWVNVKGNIWKINLSNIKNYSDFSLANNTNIGFIKVGEVIKGNKLTARKDLKSEWDFSSDRKNLFVYLKKNPGMIGKDIRIVSDVKIISLSSNMVVRDIVLEGTGAHGIQGISVNNVRLSNLEIRNIGGSFLKSYGEGQTRYGNGIEFLQSASNCIIEHCKVENVYDAALTIQALHANALFANLLFTNNILNRNEQSFEFWLKSENSAIKNCKFDSNQCANAGLGWAHSVRPEKNVAVHLLCYFSTGDISGLSISNNTFNCAKTAYMYMHDNLSASGIFSSNNNNISLDNNIPLCITNNKAMLFKTLQQLKDYYGIEKKSLVSYRTK